MLFFALFQSPPCNRITSLSRGFLADMSNSYGTYLRCFPSNFMLFCNCRSTPAHFTWKGGEINGCDFYLCSVRRSGYSRLLYLQVAWRTVLRERQALIPGKQEAPRYSQYRGASCFVLWDSWNFHFSALIIRTCGQKVKEFLLSRSYLL